MRTNKKILGTLIVGLVLIKALTYEVGIERTDKVLENTVTVKASEINITDIVSYVEQVKEELEAIKIEQVKETKAVKKKEVTKVKTVKVKKKKQNTVVALNNSDVIPMGVTSDILLKINKPDSNYNGKVVKLSKNDRYILEHLVMGEAGNQGYIGASLVAQTIRDTMVYKNIKTVEEVRISHRYSGRIDIEPNQDVIDACRFIFDEGGCAVKSKLFYFYAPGVVQSKWHESQNFVVEYREHRFFKTWN